MPGPASVERCLGGAFASPGAPRSGEAATVTMNHHKTRRSLCWFFVTNKHNPSKKSGLGASISSRITMVIRIQSVKTRPIDREKCSAGGVRKVTTGMTGLWRPGFPRRRLFFRPPQLCSQYTSALASSLSEETRPPGAGTVRFA